MSMMTPTTTLEAVNTMLSIVGEAPVSSLEDSGLVDAVIAQGILQQVSRDIQTRGWHWNTEIDYTIVPSFPDKHLILPRNTLRVDSVGKSRSKDVVQRGRRLWDRRKHTFQFDEPLVVDLVVGLEFDEMPEVARRYITIRAGRVFQGRVLGSDTLAIFSETDEAQAYFTLCEADTDTADYNLRDSWAVTRMLQR